MFHECSLEKQKDSTHIQDQSDANKALVTVWEYNEQSRSIACIMARYVGRPSPHKDLNYK